MEPFTMSLINCTSVIVDHVESGITQKEVASLYAMAIVSASREDDVPDWRAINAAIIKRWNMGALERVKKMAWKLAGAAA